MTRRRFIQDRKTGELIEVTSDYQPELCIDSGALWGDRSYDGLRAPDGADISTRTKHRDYMKARGVTTADDFSSTWNQARQERENYVKHGGTFKRGDIERAIHQLQSKR